MVKKHMAIYYADNSGTSISILEPVGALLFKTGHLLNFYQLNHGVPDILVLRGKGGNWYVEYKIERGLPAISGIGWVWKLL